MNADDIYATAKKIADNEYVVHPKISITMSCGETIRKNYKRAMSPMVAERLACLIIKHHRKTCVVCHQ